MKNCHCPLFDALIDQIRQNETEFDSTVSSALIEDASACCCLALLLFLTIHRKDVPAFISDMRDNILAVYGLRANS